MIVKDKVALITGAGSGIGRAIARSLAGRGCHLALIDIDAGGLAETAEQVRETSVRVSTHVLDVTDRDAVQSLRKQALALHSAVDILVNNAGVAAGGTFAVLSEEHFDRVMNVNFQAVVQMTRTFLPHLQNRPEALIVNISSIYGIISPPEQTAYSASKFAVRGFSNALRFELERTNVSVCVVHPGGVSTNIVRNATSPEGIPEPLLRKKRATQQKFLKMPPARAGEIIVRGIEKGKARILVGSDAKMAAFLERLLPVRYWQVMKWMAGIS